MERLKMDRLKESSLFTAIADLNVFINISFFIDVYREPLINFILENSKIGWLAFSLILIIWGGFYLFPKEFLLDGEFEDKRSIAIAILEISVIILIISLVFIFAPDELHFIKGQTLYNFYKLHKESIDPKFWPLYEFLGIFNKHNVFTVLSVLTLIYTSLVMIYTKSKKWLFSLPIIALIFWVANRFDYTSILDLFLLALFPPFTGSLIYKRYRELHPTNEETYHGD
jgi:hypothetical protein